MKFKNIYKETKEDIELSLLSLWAPGMHRMRPALKDLFRREPLMAEPVFQSMFPWELTSDSNWPSYLDANIIQNLRIGTAAGGNEPRQLQTDSWKELKSGNSIVVTSGTGSGKTECFMYPILSDLYSRKVPSGNDPVSALFLYPLNALMEDQKERLGECCRQLGLKFAVYNRSLDERTAKTASSFPAQEVMTRERVRRFYPDNTSCPQLLLTNPSMLEYMLVRDKDNEIFTRSQGALRWIVIDEAHTYTGSAAVELAYLIKRVLQAFGVTRDQVQFVCTSATIGDPNQPQQLIDFITSIIGDYSPASQSRLVNVNGSRVTGSLTPFAIQTELTARGITETTGQRVDNLRGKINSQPMTLSSIWYLLTGHTMLPSDIEIALDLIDRLCEIQIGNDYLLMARGHFFLRNIEGLYACVNTHCQGSNDYSGLGFIHLTTYRGDGKCPHCGAPLLEVVQCADCKEFLLSCEENDNHEVRPTYNAGWGNADNIADNSEVEDGDENEATDGGLVMDDNWQRTYLAFYGDNRAYLKPNPNHMEDFIAFHWDGHILKLDDSSSTRPWVMLHDSDGKLFCPTCAKGSGEDGRWFSCFHSSPEWLNGILAPSLLKESAPNGMEWGKYIAFTDSRQGTAIYAKRFNAEAERSYARARLVDELSDPNNNSIAKSIIQSLRAKGTPQAVINDVITKTPGLTGTPNYTLLETADCIFNQEMFDHIDYEISLSRSMRQHQKSEDGYKAALLRGIIGRKPVHVSNLENLGFITISYPIIDGIQPADLPNICTSVGITLDEWKNFLKICLDYYVRMGNHLQPSSYEEATYMRDSDRSTPFINWPSVKRSNTGVVPHQHRLVTLLCAGLGIQDVTTLNDRENDINVLMNEAFVFLKHNILTTIDATDSYYDVLDENGNPGKYVGWYYLDMSPDSDKCRIKLADSSWLCPVTNYILDTIFMGYSPSIKGYLCAENISRFAVAPTAKLTTVPKLRTLNYEADVASFKSIGLWNDRHKYALGQTKTGYLTAEHSGQQDRDILSYYTKQFKALPKHKINLLQCSTTMEMGVDIGNIDLVMMTNVPPTSANYMQRAGRAGRRGQSKAVALSICPNTAIGGQAFKNPTINLTSINQAIQPVESETIIQRHANSFFVRQFLLNQASSGVHFKTVDSWLNYGGHADDFLAWLSLNRADITMNSEFIKIFINRRSMSNYAQEAIDLLTGIRDEYRQTHTDIDAAINDPATSQEKKDALSIQLFALEQQDLKGYLAENRFLPNANMPTGVVEFNHMDAHTAADLKNKEDDLKQAKVDILVTNISTNTKCKLQKKIIALEENIENIHRRTISSREIKIALSEYAPGQTVVINEKNYVSAGIEWKNSLGQANPYKYIYHCQNCGRYEYTDNPNLTNCPNCNGNLRGILFSNSVAASTYAIEPVRFRMDVNTESTRRENTEKTLFDIQTILTNVDWSHATHGPLCDIVGSNDAQGEIVFINPGKGQGFSLCLDCGKMEESRIIRTGANWSHKDITEKGKQCPVNNVRNHIVLSGRFPTSFVALKFFEDSSHSSPVTDEELLYSLGVLLCRSLAKTIGISGNDIDFDIRQEQGFFSVYIYDTCKGGCGYSTRMLDTLTCNNVFAEAQQMLKGFACSCEKHVSGACVNCLVDRNSQRKEKTLSKFKLLAWFAGQSMNIATSSSGAPSVAMPLQLLATREASDKNTHSITFCVDASEMCLAEWSHKDGKIGKIIDYSISRGKTVNIYVANVPSLAKGAKLDELIPFVDLPSKFQNWGVTVNAVDSLEGLSGELSSLIVNNQKNYFTDQSDVLPFNEDWGVKCSRLFENQTVPTFTSAKFPTLHDISALMTQEEFTRDYTFSGPLHTTVGRILPDIILPHLFNQGVENVINDILHGEDVEISFSDSYVNSALSSLMLVHLIKEFKNHFGFSISKVNLQFNGPKRKCFNPLWSQNSYITFNFPCEADADNYTRGLFEDELRISPVFSAIVPDHCRWIRIVPKNGNRYVEFRPDHGIDGGWESSSKYMDLNWLDENTPIKARNEHIVYYLLVKKK